MGYSSAILKAFVLHGLILGALTFAWNMSPPLVKALKPTYMKAVILEKSKAQNKESINKGKPKLKPNVETVKIKPKKTTQHKKTVALKKEPKKEKAKQPESSPPIAMQQPDWMDSFMEEEQEIKARENQKQAVVSAVQNEEQKEGNEQLSEAEQVEVNEYQLLIYNAINRHFRPPLNACLGDKVLLEIHLFPGGEVKSVRTVESSRNDLFDKQAERAVHQAGKLPVPSSPILFQRDFKRINVLFNPQTLRAC